MTGCGFLRVTDKRAKLPQQALDFYRLERKANATPSGTAQFTGFARCIPPGLAKYHRPIDNLRHNNTGGNMTSRTAGLWRHALVSTLAVLSSTAHALTPSQVFDAVKDSVVVVKTLDAEGKQISQGSGVLLPGGRVATNCHVIKDGASFYAGRDKQFVSATVFAGNGDKDICLLNAKGIKGKSSTLGKASSLKIGEPVYAVGAPQGLELSLSDGIVSQLRGDSPPLIQTTAAISPGSSGGGLFDSQARLVGFTTLYVDGGQNLNFAIPVEWLAVIEPLAEKLVKQNVEQKTTQYTLSDHDREELQVQVRASLQDGLGDLAVTHTAFRNIDDEQAWLKEMSQRIARVMPDEAERIEFLKTLHWEASRAGVDPQLMLGLIHVKSGFRKYATSPDGARGYTQVSPYWVKTIGNPDHNLFQLRTNLRYGALILRHYIDIEKGDLYLALSRLDGSPGKPEFPNQVVGAWKRYWAYPVTKPIETRNSQAEKSK